MTFQGNSRAIAHDATSRWTRRRTNYLLWTLQTLLAALFLFAGGMKLVMPIEAMTKQILLPGWFLRFIGVAETLGALGLVLPWLLRIKPGLTPLAASGLITIMAGATTFTFRISGAGAALMPFVVGILLSLIAYGRWNALKRVPENRYSSQILTEITSTN